MRHRCPPAWSIQPERLTAEKIPPTSVQTALVLRVAAAGPAALAQEVPEEPETLPIGRAQVSPSQSAPDALASSLPSSPVRSALAERCSHAVGSQKSFKVSCLSPSVSVLNGVSPSLTEAT